MKPRHILFVQYDGTDPKPKSQEGYDVMPGSPLYNYMDEIAAWPEVIEFRNEFYILEDWNGSADARYNKVPGFRVVQLVKLTEAPPSPSGSVTDLDNGGGNTKGEN